MNTSRNVLGLTIFLVLLFCSQDVRASTVTIDFEGLADGTNLTTQYPGLIFSNATVISAGISLNEFEFPPRSGTNVAFDDGGLITIAFAEPVLMFGGYFTYLEPLSLAAFYKTAGQVASATSAFSSNDALFGDPGSSPNEFISVSFASGITAITVTGDPAGGSFVLDDVTYTSVPEPNLTYLLLLSGMVGMLAFRRLLL